MIIVIGKQANNTVERTVESLCASFRSYLPPLTLAVSFLNVSGSRRVFEKVASMFRKQKSVDELLKLADSWNGYQREKAVHQLGLVGTSIALPILIKRANDWVPQVRAASYTALKNLLVEENALAFIDALPNIYHLENCYRDDHSELIKAVESFLLSKENKAKVVGGCTSANLLVARCCLHLTIDHQLLQPYQIVLHCIGSHDVVIRSTIAKLFNLLKDDQLKEVMKFGLRDPFMSVRRTTLLLSLNQFPNNSENLLELSAFDQRPRGDRSYTLTTFRE